MDVNENRYFYEPAKGHGLPHDPLAMAQLGRRAAAVRGAVQLAIDLQ